MNLNWSSHLLVTLQLRRDSLSCWLICALPFYPAGTQLLLQQTEMYRQVHFPTDPYDDAGWQEDSRWHREDCPIACAESAIRHTVYGRTPQSWPG